MTLLGTIFLVCVAVASIPSVHGCADLNVQCPNFLAYCSLDFYKTNCPLTCGICTPTCSQPHPDIAQFGSSSVSNGVVTYTCNSGYTLIGTPTNVCQKTLTWKYPNAPTCNRSCDAPPAVPGSTFSPTTGPYLVDSQVIYACTDPGATIMGTYVMTCNSNVAWSDSSFICNTTGSCATSPPIPTNGVVMPQKSSYRNNEYVMYGCNTYYTMVGKDMNKCVNSVWKYPAPVCYIACNDTVGIDCPFRKQNGYCTDVRYPEIAILECPKTCLTCKNCTTAPISGSLTASPAGPYVAGDTVQYFCTSGRLVGDSINTCIGQETWFLSTLPACEQFCSNLPMISANGTNNPSGTTHDSGVTVVYQCESAALRLMGPSNNTCTGTTWSEPNAPKCVQICSQPPTNSELSISPNKTEYLEGDKITYSCNRGVLVGGAVAVCTSGSWNVSSVPLCDLPCDNLPTNALVSNTPNGTTHASGVMVTYMCPDGYMLMGTNENTCNDGTWFLSQAPTCVKICNDPLRGANYRLSPNASKYLEGDSITYSCIQGVTEGAAFSVCGSLANWNLTVLPNCTMEPECRNPPTTNPNVIQNTTSAPYPTGTVIQYSCPNNYVLIGVTENTCNSGAWSSSMGPECRLSCETPPSTPDLNFAPSNPTYFEGDNVTYTCMSGNIQGETISNCTNGNWTLQTENLPVCLQGCLAPPLPANGRVAVDKPLYAVNETITYVCNDGFFASGSANNTCLNTFSWLNSDVSSLQCDSANVVIVADGTDGMDDCSAISTIINLNSPYSASDINTHPAQFPNFIQQRTLIENLAVWANNTSSDIAIHEHAGSCDPETPQFQIRNFGDSTTAKAAAENMTYECGSTNLLTAVFCGNTYFDRLPAGTSNSRNITIVVVAKMDSEPTAIIGAFNSIRSMLPQDLYFMTAVPTNASEYSQNIDYISKMSCGSSYTPPCQTVIGSIWESLTDILARI